MVGGVQGSIGDNFPLLLISWKEDPARTADEGVIAEAV